MGKVIIKSYILMLLVFSPFILKNIFKKPPNFTFVAYFILTIYFRINHYSSLKILLILKSVKFDY